MPPIEGLADPRVLTSESFFERSTLPRRLSVVGGGPVGCERAEACARLGSTVALLEAAPRLLSREDPDAAEEIRAALHADGVTVMTGASVTITRGAVGQVLDVDALLVATGRRVYAAGDVCLPWQFTHAADASARLVPRNALFAGRSRASRLLVPRVTFTDPEVDQYNRARLTPRVAGMMRAWLGARRRF